MKLSFLLVLIATLLLVQGSLEVECVGSPNNFCISTQNVGSSGIFVDRGNGLELRPTLNLTVGNTYTFTLLNESQYSCHFRYEDSGYSHGVSKSILHFAGDQAVFTPDTPISFSLSFYCHAGAASSSFPINIEAIAPCVTCVGTRTNICMKCVPISEISGIRYFDRGNGYEILKNNSPFGLNTSVLYTFVHDGDTLQNCKLEYHGRQGEGEFLPNPPPSWVTGSYPLKVKGSKFYVYSEQPVSYGDIEVPSNPSLIISHGGDTHPTKDPLPLCPSRSPMPSPVPMKSHGPAVSPMGSPGRSPKPVASPMRSPKPVASPTRSSMRSPSPMQSPAEEHTSASESTHPAAGRLVASLLLAVIVLAFSL